MSEYYFHWYIWMWSVLINEMTWKMVEACKGNSGPSERVGFFTCILLSSARKLSALTHLGTCQLYPKSQPSQQHQLITGSWCHPPSLPFAYHWHSSFQQEPVIPSAFCPLLKLLLLIIYRGLIPTLKEKSGCQQVPPLLLLLLAKGLGQWQLG